MSFRVVSCSPNIYTTGISKAEEKDKNIWINNDDKFFKFVKYHTSIDAGSSIKQKKKGNCAKAHHSQIAKNQW